MTQCKRINVKVSNSQLHKLKLTATNAEEVTLSLSSSMIGSTTDDTTFLHKLSLAQRQVSSICMVFVYNFSASKNIYQK